jgi:hypothetical protein
MDTSITTGPSLRPARRDKRLRSEVRSKVIMERCLAHLRVNPTSMRSRAREHLDLIAREQLAHRKYIEAWRTLIELSPDEIADVVLTDSEKAITLRSMNPFSLPAEERDRIFAQFRNWPDTGT